MSENLNVETFNNGDPIPQATNVDAWYKASYQDKTPVWCYYSFDEGKGKIYGKLYNWYAINDPRGIAPDGWRIPTQSDFEKLLNYTTTNFEEYAVALKSKELWEKSNLHSGTNETGFNAIGGGFTNITGTCENILEQTKFWTSTEYESLENDQAYGLTLYLDLPPSLYSNLKAYGCYVRCVKE